MKLLKDITGVLDRLSKALEERKSFETDVSKLEKWLELSEPPTSKTPVLLVPLETLQQNLNAVQVRLKYQGLGSIRRTVCHELT